MNSIFLKSFSFRETRDSDIELSVLPVHLDNFNLFIGDNAQGKTRIFNVLSFMKRLLTDTSRGQLVTNFTATFKFEIKSNKKTSIVTYDINIVPSNEGNNYFEEIKKKKLTLLSTKNKELYNEKSEAYVDNFFIPKNIPAISAIDGEEYPTIKNIKEFFLRMMFIESTKSREIMIDPSAKVLNPSATNLASVLLNWQEHNLEIYQELIEDFRKCFSQVENVKLAKRPIQNLGIVGPLLTLKEQHVNKDIFQAEWSDGFIRTLSFLILPKTRFEFNGRTYPPSLICIDEIENGLDFKTLKFILNYLEEYTDQIQLVFSTHSPSLSEFVHPRYWHVVKRIGSDIKVSKPSKIESENLEEMLELFKQRHWDFYTKHISNSSLYKPK